MESEVRSEPLLLLPSRSVPQENWWWHNQGHRRLEGPQVYRTADDPDQTGYCYCRFLLSNWIVKWIYIASQQPSSISNLGSCQPTSCSYELTLLWSFGKYYRVATLSWNQKAIFFCLNCCLELTVTEIWNYRKAPFVKSSLKYI